jgi:hypothetical protein
MNRFLLSYIILASFVLFLMAAAALSHEATTIQGEPLGWSYPVSCCSNKDCREVPATTLTPVKGGWRVELNGQFIPNNSSKLRDSPDGRYHLCMAGAKFTPTGTALCIFTPPMGF